MLASFYLSGFWWVKVIMFLDGIPFVITLFNVRWYGGRDGPPHGFLGSCAQPGGLPQEQRIRRVVSPPVARSSFLFCSDSDYFHYLYKKNRAKNSGISVIK